MEYIRPTGCVNKYLIGFQHGLEDGKAMAVMAALSACGGKLGVPGRIMPSYSIDIGELAPIFKLMGYDTDCVTKCTWHSRRYNKDSTETEFDWQELTLDKRLVTIANNLMEICGTLYDSSSKTYAKGHGKGFAVAMKGYMDINLSSTSSLALDEVFYKNYGARQRFIVECLCLMGEKLGFNDWDQAWLEKSFPPDFKGLNPAINQMCTKLYTALEVLPGMPKYEEAKKDFETRAKNQKK